MPGYLLHENAGVLCLHAGQARPSLPFPRVTLSGQAVTTQAAAYTVSACAFNPGAPSPCVTVQWTSAATRVRAGGVPVLLQDSQAVCAPNGTGVTVVATQPRVKGI